MRNRTTGETRACIRCGVTRWVSSKAKTNLCRDCWHTLNREERVLWAA